MACYCGHAEEEHEDGGECEAEGCDCVIFEDDPDDDGEDEDDDDGA